MALTEPIVRREIFGVTTILERRIGARRRARDRNIAVVLPNSEGVANQQVTVENSAVNSSGRGEFEIQVDTGIEIDLQAIEGHNDVRMAK